MIDYFLAKKLAFGAATYLPGVLILRRWLLPMNTGSYSARYCYSVWLRHRVAIERAGLRCRPKIVAELGPGGSLGVGIAALLSGVRSYWAFDVRHDSRLDRNLAVFAELERLFRIRAEIPNDLEFPDVKPRLESYAFPADLVAFEPQRALDVRKALETNGLSGAVDVRYVVPWQGPAAQPETVDLIVSQAVMEHVENPGEVYESSQRWLKSGGIASHQIDFASHGSAREWNGHWAYSSSIWKIMKGRKSFLLNRLPLSAHLKMIERSGLRVVSVVRFRDTQGLDRRRLAREFRHITDDDLATRGAHVVAQKA